MSEVDLREKHLARARSAAFRAAATCHYIRRRGAEDKREENEAAQMLWKAEHAARVAAQALAVLAESAPAPAADSRCARNAAASAAQAAQMGMRWDGEGERAAAACHMAVRASQSAAAAAAAGAEGEDAALNARADADEEAALVAAQEAGWVEPGRQLPEISAGLRSADLMAMLHL